MSEKKEKMTPEYVKKTIAKALRVTSGLKAGGTKYQPPPMTMMYGLRID